MYKEHEFVKNTIILLIGKFSTQIVSFLLLPLYTYKLSTSDYGYIDLVQTYISLIAPIFLLQLDSAIFRYLIDVRKEKQYKSKIITSSFFCLCFILFVTTIFSYVLSKFIVLKYYFLIIFNIYAIVLNMYIMAIARGNGNNKHYSIASCITAILNLAINVVLIAFCGFNAESILISAIVSNIISFIYIFIIEKVYLFIQFNCIDFKILSKLLKYSIPMIPNALSWWIVGLSDRTIIVKLISTSANGIYSVACKFSNLLNNFFSIFNMSWQETASLHINDKDADIFFSNIIDNIFNLFIFISCCIIGILPLIFDICIGNEYIEAYIYIPIVLLGNIFSVLVGLFGGIYIAKKMTNKVAITTIYSAIINILINIIFIGKLKLFAACLSTVLAYFIMSIYRYYDIKKYLNIKLDIKKYSKYLIFFIIMLIPYYLYKKYLLLFILIVISIIYFYENRKFILSYLERIKSKFYFSRVK